MISNKEDAVTLCEFLKALQERTGPMTTKYFMSDDAEQYYSSWNYIYGGNLKKLLCTWHIDRAWRVNIRSMISDNKKQITVYHQLSTLLEESSIVRFCLQCCTWVHISCIASTDQTLSDYTCDLCV